MGGLQTGIILALMILWWRQVKRNLSRVTLARESDRNKQCYSWKEGVVAVSLPKCTPAQSLLAADSFLRSTSQCQGNGPRF